MDEALGLNPNTSVNESMNERISQQNVWLGTLPRDAVLVLGLLVYRRLLLRIPPSQAGPLVGPTDSQKHPALLKKGVKLGGKAQRGD